MDADDVAIGKKLSQDSESDAVVGIVEGRHEDKAVGDVEVGVAGGKTLVAEDNRTWQGQFDEGELLAVEGTCSFKASEILGERFVVGVASYSARQR